MMTELFVMAMWVLQVLHTHIAFRGQNGKLAPVIPRLRKSLVPAVLFALGIAPLAHAQAIRGALPAGSNIEEHSGVAGAQREGISLDEAVRMAESQYHAKVVRTDVQDEDGRKVYVLKLLSEGGRVITVRIDAASGRMR
jgi:Peptidase propeptide and YPEB domain